MILKEVKTILRENCGLKPADKLVVGVSGGADSVAMLDLLVKCGFSLIVAHFNHQLRLTAVRDEEFVQALARRYQLEYSCEREDIRQLAKVTHQNLEKCAREARYAFLFQLAQDRGVAAVLVAHQADDQVETVLLNLLRGTGLKGLTGMHTCAISAYHAEIPLVRPLLRYWHVELAQYCRQTGNAYIEDESNRDTKYRRNRVRLELIPQLESYNPRVKAALLRMSELLQADADLLQNDISTAMKEITHSGNHGRLELDLPIFRNLPIALQRNLLRHLIHENIPQLEDLGAAQVEKARQVLAGETRSKNLHLDHRFLVRVEGNKGWLGEIDEANEPGEEWPILIAEMQVPCVDGEVQLAKNWKLTVRVIAKSVDGEAYQKNRDPFTAYLDLHGQQSPLDLRHWQTGDRYQPLGMKSGRIKVSDFWINHKVPQRAKRYWPLVVQAGNLLWIPGFAPSENARVTKATIELVVLTLRKVSS